MKLEYDYTNQCWIKDGIIQACSHPKDDCGCYGKEHGGRRSAEVRKWSNR